MYEEGVKMGLKKMFFLVFVMVGIAVLFWGYGSFQKSQEAKSWPTTKGKIISSEIHSYWSHSGTGRKRHMKMMYGAKVQYKYSADGKTYLSDRISFGEFDSSSRKDAQKVVDKYPPDKEISVYHDPAKPENAVLEPGKRGGIFIAFIVGGLFILVGIVGMISKQA